MKVSLKLIFLVLVLAVNYSCDSSKKEVEALKDDVISIHDEVMPLMGEVKSEQKRILKMADKLQMEDSLGNREVIEAMRKTASSLEEAYDGMFVWMRQYNGELEGLTDEEAISYLHEQKEKVIKVNEEIKNALEEAKKIEE